MTGGARHEGEPAARDRIVGAAIRTVAHRGVHHATMAVIAESAGVSKALLHYHFADRDALLGQAVLRLGERMVHRERRTFGREGVAPIDALWQWCRDELERGELRALLQLGTLDEPAVRGAAAEVRSHRLSSAQRTIGELFARLSLSPRLATALIAATHLTFIDGLAMSGVGLEEARRRFDVFWLASLTLGS